MRTTCLIRRYDPGMLQVPISAILSLGDTPSAFGQTLALLITFLGIGLLANLIIVYIIGQVMVERRQNQERMREFDAKHDL
jgi:hypothetical protein